MHSFDLDLNDISKIEGHTNMSVKVRDDKVTECHLEISEGKRFFKQAITGMSYDLVPSTMSRICGTCSAAHALCSVEAIENAYDVRVTKQTKILKNLLMNGGHLRDHAMHLYFFCLPDVFKKESVFDFGVIQVQQSYEQAECKVGFKFHNFPGVLCDIKVFALSLLIR